MIRSTLDLLFGNLKNLDVNNKEFTTLIETELNKYTKCDYKIKSEPQKLIMTEKWDKDISGYIRIEYSSLIWDCCIFKKNNKKLFVTFDGARTTNGRMRSIPIFPRWTWHKYVEADFICMEDPMYYEFPNLKLGWFYGTKEMDYAIYASNIISKYCKDNDIRMENVVLYGSSGGGTTAIRVAHYLPESICIAINPQLDIAHYYLSKDFVNNTKLDLEEKDEYYRNNLAELIYNDSSKYLVIVNCESEYDFRRQLLEGFIEKINLKIRYGLTRKENIATWIYDAPSNNPHTAFEDFWLFSVILDTAANLWDKEYEEVVLHANGYWREKYLIRREKENIFSGFVTSIENPNINFADERYRKKLHMSSKESNYTHAIIQKKLKSKTLYNLKIGNVVMNNKTTITVGVFNYKNNAFEKRIDLNLHENKIDIYFLTGNDTNSLALILYNGQVGTTIGNNITFENIELFEVATSEC